MSKKEDIYDEQINPLMERIIAISKEHNIPFVASFQLDDDLTEAPDLTVNSANVPEGSMPLMVDLYNRIKAHLQPPMFAAFTIIETKKEAQTDGT